MKNEKAEQGENRLIIGEIDLKRWTYDYKITRYSEDWFEGAQGTCKVYPGDQKKFENKVENGSLAEGKRYD